MKRYFFHFSTNPDLIITADSIIEALEYAFGSWDEVGKDTVDDSNLLRITIENIKDTNK
jgi:hypothetical protein